MQLGIRASAFGSDAYPVLRRYRLLCLEKRANHTQIFPALQLYVAACPALPEPEPEPGPVVLAKRRDPPRKVS